MENTITQSTMPFGKAEAEAAMALLGRYKSGKASLEERIKEEKRQEKERIKEEKLQEKRRIKEENELAKQVLKENREGKGSKAFTWILLILISMILITSVVVGLSFFGIGIDFEVFEGIWEQIKNIW